MEARWGARFGVYQPFTIETLIYHSATSQKLECGFRRFFAAC